MLPGTSRLICYQVLVLVHVKQNVLYTILLLCRTCKEQSDCGKNKNSKDKVETNIQSHFHEFLKETGCSTISIKYYIGNKVSKK